MIMPECSQKLLQIRVVICQAASSIHSYFRPVDGYILQIKLILQITGLNVSTQVITHDHDLNLSNCIAKSKIYLLHINMRWRSEEHTAELQSRGHLVCRLLLAKKIDSSA